MLLHKGICRRRTRPMAGVSAFRAVEINARAPGQHSSIRTPQCPRRLPLSLCWTGGGSLSICATPAVTSSDVAEQFEALPTNLAWLTAAQTAPCHGTLHSDKLMSTMQPPGFQRSSVECIDDGRSTAFRSPQFEWRAVLASRFYYYNGINSICNRGRGSSIRCQHSLLEWPRYQPTVTRI